MFDFRYHVVSLAAVFLALVIGILVGIGLSGRGFVDDAERKNLEQEIAELENDRAQLAQSADAATSRLLALQDLAQRVEEPLGRSRLRDRRVALLFVGGVPGPVNQAARRAVEEAGGRVVKTGVVRVPYDQAAVLRSLAGRPALARSIAGGVDDIGRMLAEELLEGGRTPLWRALSGSLAAIRSGEPSTAVDAVVVARAVPPQRGITQLFLSSLYTAVGANGVPAVGVQEVGAEKATVPVFARHGLSTVDSVDTAPGRLALVILLAGGKPGHYGVDETARDGILPPFVASER